MKTEVPVLTIDGPSGAGKGTVSRLVSRRLGWHYLESGSIYRVLALLAWRRQIAPENEAALCRLAVDMDLRFECDGDHRILLDGQDVSDQVRSESCGRLASEIASVAGVRGVLVEKQRSFRQPPGLVAEGRDMGTVIFPDAPWKVFLTASPEVRAERRYNQLKDQGLDVTLPKITEDMRKRDLQDSRRSTAPLRAAPDAAQVDSSGLSIEDVVARILALIGSP